MIDIIIIVCIIFLQYGEIAMNNTLDFRKVGNRIQRFRLENKMTQEALAERIGSTQKYISSLEAGNHRSHFDTMVAIARALNISIDSLVADYDDSTDESTLKLILDDIRGMDKKQLDMLRDNIQTIKKYNS